jgi:pimeloyl-ACP methyl ester carboxylesterase
VPPIDDTVPRDEAFAREDSEIALAATPKKLDLGAYTLFAPPPKPSPKIGPRFDTSIDVVASLPKDPNVAMAEWWRHWNFEYAIYGRGINIQTPIAGGFNILPLIEWLGKKAKEVRRPSFVTATMLPRETLPSRAEGLKAVRVNGVELHYTHRGAGEPIVFVHGGLADYREWEPVAADLASRYRTVLYSRRYNFPNDNRLRDGHSATVEADDLAALIRALGLAPARVVGVSYGAYTALLLGLRHRELVHSLVLVEPPLVRWLPDLPGGKAVYDDFMSRLWTPAGRSFKAGDAAGALRVTLDYFVGPGAADSIPEAFRAQLLSNIREWEALTTSSDAFPRVERSEVGRLDVPVLILTGENTYPIAKIVDPELARLLPAGRREIIAGGTHDMCTEKPAGCATAIGGFFATN